jgi:hypothetical protein
MVSTEGACQAHYRYRVSASVGQGLAPAIGEEPGS